MNFHQEFRPKNFSRQGGEAPRHWRFHQKRKINEPEKIFDKFLKWNFSENYGRPCFAWGSPDENSAKSSVGMLSSQCTMAEQSNPKKNKARFIAERKSPQTRASRELFGTSEIWVLRMKYAHEPGFSKFLLDQRKIKGQQWVCFRSVCSRGFRDLWCVLSGSVFGQVKISDFRRALELKLFQFRKEKLRTTLLPPLSHTLPDRQNPVIKSDHPHTHHPKVDFHIYLCLPQISQFVASIRIFNS